jgi:hypothetical protein
MKLISISIILIIAASLLASSNAGFTYLSINSDITNRETPTEVDFDKANTKDTEKRTHTRAITNEIINDGGTVTWTGQTGEYNNVWVYNGSTLQIEDSDITINNKFNITSHINPANLIVINSNIQLTKGTMETDCQSVSITGSTIHATNKFNPPGDPQGLPSDIVIKTIDDILIQDSDIISEGDYSDPGGPGGIGTLYIESEGKVTIKGKADKGLIGLGGDGSDGEGNNRGQQGGNAFITVKAGDAITIEDATIKSESGEGGSPRGKSGRAYCDLIAGSTKPITIVRSHVGAEPGLGGDSDPFYASTGTFKAQGKDFTVDRANYLDTRNSKLTTIYGDSISLNASGICELYNVNIKTFNIKYPVFASGDLTTARIFFWLKVLVKDNSERPLSDANVFILDKSGFDVYSSKSDTNGITEFDGPIEGRTLTQANPVINKYTLKAAALGEEVSKEGVQVTDSITEEVILTLLTIKVTGVNGLIPSNEMTVGCAVTIVGTITKPSAYATQTPTVSVSVGGSDIVPGPTDESQDKSWSQWQLIWNSLSVDDNKVHSLIFKVEIGSSLSDTDILNLSVDQTSCNHAPQVTLISNPKNNEKISDTEAQPSTVIAGQAFDEDYNAALAKGTSIEYVTLTIYNSNASLVYSENRVNAAMEYDATSGVYNWNFIWNTREEGIGGYYTYPNGVYTITLSAYDGDLVSQSWGIKNVTVELYHLIDPVAIIFKVDDEKVIDHTEVIKFKTSSETITIEFDGEESFDLDGTMEELEFNWDFGNDETSGWVKTPIITHDFKVDTDRKHTSFTVTLTIRDNDTLTSTGQGDSNKVKLEVEYEPPEGDPEGPFVSVLSINLKSGSMFLYMIILIIIVNIIGASIITFNNRRILKQREAQKIMMDKQRRELAAEIAKERAASGYGDFTSDYMVTEAESKAAPKATEAAQQGLDVKTPPQPQAAAQPQQPQAQPQAAQAGAAPKPAAPAPAPPAPPPAPAPAPAAPAAPAAPKPQVTTATVQAPGAAAPPQQVPVYQGTPTPPKAVGEDVSSQMTSYQVRQCPKCRATVHSGFNECPQCHSKR